MRFGFVSSRKVLYRGLLAAGIVGFAESASGTTTNTYTRTSSAGEDIAWVTAFTNDVTTGSDVSIKIDYAEGGEKYQRIKTDNLPIYLDSVIGGKYHNLSLVAGSDKGRKYAVINDPTPFEGFWALDSSSGRTSGIYLPDNGGAGVRTIGSASIRGRFQFGVATDCEAILDYPFGLGMFEVNRKSGNPENMQPDSLLPEGKLTVNRSPGPYSVAQVRRGALGIVGGDDDVSSPVPGAWVRFDASAVDSFTLEGETGVVQWRDADGRGVFASVEGYANRPQRVLDAVTGKTLVDFGFRSGASDTARGGSRLRFPENVSGVGELFMVFREKSDFGEPVSFFSRAFPRNSASNQLFSAWASLPKELAMGEIRLNGQAVIPNVGHNFTKGLNVVSAGYRSGGGDVLYFGSGRNTTNNDPVAGGDVIAEVILYTNTLTSAQRRHNNEYLMKKWLGHGVRDYGAIMLDKLASLSVESGTARVRELQLATNRFVKAGRGNLEVESLNTNLASLVVSGGKVRFVNTLERGDSPQPAADPFAWFDADDSTSFETFTSNYTGNAGMLAPTNYTFVKVWHDKRTNDFTLARVGALNHKNCGDGSSAVADETPYPTLDTTTWTRPMVDLGPFYHQTAAKHYGWINGNSGLSTWLRLFKKGTATDWKDPAIQGFVVFYKTESRGNPINSDGGDLRNAGGDNPKDMFVTDWYANTASVSGHWTYDGATVNPGKVALLADGKAHLGSFLFADTSLKVNVFGADMNIGGNGCGGCKIAEVILYNRVLTEQERLDTERYLMAKWNCGTHPADKAISSVGTLSLGEGVETVFDNANDIAYGKVVRETSGEVVKKGAGAATVKIFDPTATDVTAVSVEEGSLSLWCDPICDAWSHLDAMRPDSIVYSTTNGTNYVSSWKDVSGHGNHATTPSGLLYKPTYHSVRLDSDNMIAESGREMMVVDMGEYYNYEQLGVSSWVPTNTAAGMVFANTPSPLQEFYVVHADTDHMNGAGKSNYNGILGFSSWADPAIYPDAFPFMRIGRSPIIDANGTTSLRSGYIGVNGETRSSSYGPTLRQLNVYTVSASQQISKDWALAKRMSSQWGGQVLGEVILFNEANTEARRNAITAMLCNKWRAEGTPVVPSWTFGSLAVSEGSSLTVGGSKGFAYTATTISGLGSIASGPDLVGVENVVLGSEGKTGTLSFAGDVTIATNAHVDVYVDADARVSNMAVTGRLAFGGPCAVSLHLPAGVRVPVGEYPLFTATKGIEGFAVRWTVAKPAGFKDSAKIVYDAEGKSVLLRIYLDGLSVMIR